VGNNISTYRGRAKIFWGVFKFSDRFPRKKTGVPRAATSEYLALPRYVPRLFHTARPRYKKFHSHEPDSGSTKVLMPKETNACWLPRGSWRGSRSRITKGSLIRDTYIIYSESCLRNKMERDSWIASHKSIRWKKTHMTQVCALERCLSGVLYSSLWICRALQSCSNWDAILHIVRTRPSTYSTEGSAQKETYITDWTGFLYEKNCTAHIADVCVKGKRPMSHITEGSLWQEIHVNVLYRALHKKRPTSCITCVVGYSTLQQAKGQSTQTTPLTMWS